MMSPMATKLLRLILTFIMLASNIFKQAKKLICVMVYIIGKV